MYTSQHSNKSVRNAYVPLEYLPENIYEFHVPLGGGRMLLNFEYGVAAVHGSFCLSVMSEVDVVGAGGIFFLSLLFFSHIRCRVYGMM